MNNCQTPDNLDDNSTTLLLDDMPYLLAKMVTISYLLFNNTQELFMKEKQNNVAKSHKNASFLLNMLSSQTLGIAQSNITIALNKTWRFESLCSSERVCDSDAPLNLQLRFV